MWLYSKAEISRRPGDQATKTIAAPKIFSYEERGRRSHHHTLALFRTTASSPKEPIKQSEFFLKNKQRKKSTIESKSRDRLLISGNSKARKRGRSISIRNSERRNTQTLCFMARFCTLASTGHKENTRPCRPRKTPTVEAKIRFSETALSGPPAGIRSKKQKMKASAKSPVVSQKTAKPRVMNKIFPTTVGTLTEKSRRG